MGLTKTRKTVLLVVLSFLLIGSSVPFWNMATNDEQIRGLQKEPNVTITIGKVASVIAPQQKPKAPAKAPSTPAARPPCSLENIKRFTLSRSYFLDSEAWTHQSKVSKQYKPGWCYYPLNLLPRTYYESCLARKNIRKIVVSGDSNASRFMKSVKATFGCTKVSGEVNSKSKFLPNPGYYMKDARPMVYHARTCRFCHSAKYKCPKFNLEVEFISQEYVIDTELTTFRMRPPDEKIGLVRLCNVGINPGVKKGYPGGLPCVDTQNSQQFLLKEYFNGKYPDLWLYFSNNHDRQIFTADEFGMYNRLLGDMFDLYLPNTTKLVWMTKLHEEVFVQPSPWKEAKYEGLYGANDQIKRMNRRLFLTSREYFKKRANFYPFFDLQSMGAGVAQDWKLDGVHKHVMWYKHLQSYIFQSVCL